MDDGVDDNPTEPASPMSASDRPPTGDTAAARETDVTEPPAELIKLDIASDVRAAAENRYERRPLLPHRDVVLSQADDVEFRGAQKVMIDPPKTPAQQKTQLLL